MSAAVMHAPMAQLSPIFNARLAGFFWLMVVFTGSFSMVTYQKVVVGNDAAATIANLAAHEQLFRAGVVSDIAATVCYLVATLLVYALLKPVNANLSLLGAFFSLSGCVISTFSFACRLGTLSVESAPLVDALIKLNEQAISIAFAFFGLHCAVVGTLILKSTFMPRLVGGLMVAGGVGWITFSLISLLAPALLTVVRPFVMAPGAIGEITLSLWLLIKGVNVQRWNEAAS